MLARRLKAPQARTSDAPSATSAFSRSSSSGDHGRDIGRISTSEDNRANREDGRAHPNVGGNSLLRTDRVLVMAK